MSDPGAVGRNVAANAVALERAAQRNGGQNLPSSPPSSVTAADPVPSRAVDVPRPHIPTNDAVVSWGRNGQTEVSPERGAPAIPPGLETFGGINPEHTGVSTAPSTFGAGPQPDVNRNRSWNASDIFGNTKIGG